MIQHQAFSLIRRKPKGSLDRSSPGSVLYHVHAVWRHQPQRDLLGILSGSRCDRQQPATVSRPRGVEPVYETMD
jgi:hypothetical protein